MTHRRTVAAAALVGLALALIPASTAGASGGGGCGGPVTSATGIAITIKDYCFGPTVLYAQPGETVTWTNKDRGIPHNVAGANMAWGSFETIRRNKSVSYAFDEAGVYSYVCTVHPGMVGTVVVGDPVPGETTPVDAVRRISRVSAVQPGPLTPATDESKEPALWLTTIGVLIAAAVVVVGRRVRRHD